MQYEAVLTLFFIVQIETFQFDMLLLLILLLFSGAEYKKHGNSDSCKAEHKISRNAFNFLEIRDILEWFRKAKNYIIISSHWSLSAMCKSL